MSESITYKIYLDKLKQHLLCVECTIRNPTEDGQVVSIPAWVPGSYLIRDFAKHIVAISATSHGAEVNMQKLSKNVWQCAPCSGPLVITYFAYCFDLAARGAYVDHTRVFFDGARIFLIVEGEEEQTRTVEIVPSQFTKSAQWRCATSMTPLKIDAAGFGTYVANNHLELIDHPFEISDFKSLEFEVANVPHKIIVSGKAVADYDRLVADVQKICASQVQFFGELPKLRQYIFILSIVAKGWGGIEHRASSSLVSTRSALPKFGEETKSSDYKSLLGLFSHEYFHLWNVKRIKPEVFLNPDLNREVYTRQLWIFEGITAYYDNLNCVQAQVLTPKEYIQILQDDINVMLQTPGMHKQTLDESSYDAWIKFYQPDENTVNSSISYYLKGCLVALALDLLIIKNTKRKQSLADIMQILWQQYGKTGLGLPEGYFEQLTYEIIGEDYREFFDMAVRSTKPLELTHLLQSVGVKYKNKPLSVLDNVGLKVQTDQNKLTVKSVLNDSVAEHAGLAPNDVIVAVNNFAVNNSNFESTLGANPAHEELQLHVFRNDILLELVMLNPPLSNQLCELEIVDDADEQQLQNRQKWLGA
ncbi:MAG TPA: PDZ domain-containing protein [Gammaproteobacteria bacterium]|nr:PDZ domain-containing protein [Gammaproteobacteria bacterium]